MEPAVAHFPAIDEGVEPVIDLSRLFVLYEHRSVGIDFEIYPPVVAGYGRARKTLLEPIGILERADFEARERHRFEFGVKEHCMDVVKGIVGTEKSLFLFVAGAAQKVVFYLLSAAVENAESVPLFEFYIGHFAHGEILVEENIQLQRSLVGVGQGIKYLDDRLSSCLSDAGVFLRQKTVYVPVGGPFHLFKTGEHFPVHGVYRTAADAVVGVVQQKLFVGVVDKFPVGAFPFDRAKGADGQGVLFQLGLAVVIGAL